MAITRPAPKTVHPQTQDLFINSAPDGAKIKGVRKGNKQQISLTIQPALLERIDSLAEELGQSRAAVINLAIFRAVEKGLIN